MEILQTISGPAQWILGILALAAAIGGIHFAFQFLKAVVEQYNQE